jgi:hypothetical protein
MTKPPDTHVDGGKRTVELYVRSLAPRGAHRQLEELLEKLESLQARGDVVEYSVHVWGARIDPTSAMAETDAGQFLRERVRAFSEWASENGYSTGSFFEAEPIESTITGEEYAAMTLPTATLAEYVDGELAFVTPCTNGETVYTTADRLEALSGNDLASKGSRAVSPQTN